MKIQTLCAAAAIMLGAFGCNPAPSTSTDAAKDPASGASSMEAKPANEGAAGTTTVAMGKCEMCSVEVEEAKLKTVDGKKMCEVCAGKASGEHKTEEGKPESL